MGVQFLVIPNVDILAGNQIPDGIQRASSINIIDQGSSHPLLSLKQKVTQLHLNLPKKIYFLDRILGVIECVLPGMQEKGESHACSCVSLRLP